MNVNTDPAEQRGLVNLTERLRGSGDLRGSWIASLIERGLRVVGEADGADGWAEVDRFVRSGEREGLAGFASDRSHPVSAPGLSQIGEHEEARRLIGVLVAQIDMAHLRR